MPGIGGSRLQAGLHRACARRWATWPWRCSTGPLCSGDPLLGPDGAALGNDEQLHTWFKSISLTIAAGTSQVQRNIVAERILGLPKKVR